jgi:hypothetical protein
VGLQHAMTCELRPSCPKRQEWSVPTAAASDIFGSTLAPWARRRRNGAASLGGPFVRTSRAEAAFAHDSRPLDCYGKCGTTGSLAGPVCRIFLSTPCFLRGAWLTAVWGCLTCLRPSALARMAVTLPDD